MLLQQSVHTPPDLNFPYVCLSFLHPFAAHVRVPRPSLMDHGNVPHLGSTDLGMQTPHTGYSVNNRWLNEYTGVEKPPGFNVSVEFGVASIPTTVQILNADVQRALFMYPGLSGI